MDLRHFNFVQVCFGQIHFEVVLVAFHILQFSILDLFTSEFQTFLFNRHFELVEHCLSFEVV